MTEIGKGKIMDWINITTLLRIVDLRCHDDNNKQMVKVRERLWSCFIQKKSKCLRSVGNGKPSLVLKSDGLLMNLSRLTCSLCRLRRSIITAAWGTC